MSGYVVMTDLSLSYYARLNSCNFFQFLVEIFAHFLGSVGSSLVKRIHDHIISKYKINVTKLHTTAEGVKDCLKMRLLAILCCICIK